MSTKKRGRGRPPVYTGQIRNQIVSLLKKQKNATRVRAILSSRNGVVGIKKTEQADAKVRKALGVEKPVSISMPTLLGIAAKAGIDLQRGRPKLDEAAA